MNWEIYSIGDAAFLERIMNAVAMITGTGDFKQMVSIGLLVGVVMVAMQSVMSGGRELNFHYAVIGWVLYAGFFGHGTTVQIEDAYNGQVRVVDNVPLGVAAAGGIISRIGYGLTRLFEQGFGAPEMTDNGFASSLDALATVRKSMMTPAGVGSANSPESGDDFWVSWTNYVKECTMLGVERGEYSIGDIRSFSRPGVGASAIDQLRYDSRVNGTRIHINGAPNDGYLNCADAHDYLSTATSSRYIDALKINVAKHLGAYSDEVNAGPGGGTGAMAYGEMRINQAFQGFNQAGVDSQEYMLSTALFPMFEWGLAANEHDFQRSALASMIHDGIQQRNSQWVGEQALFQTMVRPMMTFFEGFVFAITPLMGFLFALGPQGISIAGKYFFVLLWIQLWLPTAAIVNLFLHMSVSREMGALSAPGFDGVAIESFYGIQAMDMTLQNWIATGGLLASSIPALTLMLIYGSAVTATHLSGRLQGGDFLDQKRGSPDSLQTGAVMNQAEWASANRMRGVEYSGAEQMEYQINAGQQAQRTTEALSQQAVTDQRAFSQALGQSTRNGQAFSGMSSSGIANRMQEAAGYSQTAQFVENFAGRVSEAGGFESAETQRLATQVLGQLTANGALGSGNAQVAAGAAATTIDSLDISESQKEELKSAFETVFQSGDTWSSDFTQAVSADLSGEYAEKVAETFGIEDTESVQDSASRAYSSQQQLRQAEKVSENIGADRTMTGAQVGQKAVENRGLARALEGWAANNPSKNGLIDQATAEQVRMGMSEDQARYGAIAFAIASGDGGDLEGAKVLQKALSMDTGTNVLGDTRTNDAVGAGARAQGAGALAERVAQDLGPNVGASEIQGMMNDVKSRTPSGVPASGEFFGREGTQEARDNFRSMLSSERQASFDRFSQDEQDRMVAAGAEYLENTEGSAASGVQRTAGRFMDWMRGEGVHGLTSNTGLMSEGQMNDRIGLARGQENYGGGYSGMGAQATPESIREGQERALPSAAADISSRLQEQGFRAPDAAYLGYQMASQYSGVENQAAKADAVAGMYARYGMENGQKLMAAMDRMPGQTGDRLDSAMNSYTTMIDRSADLRGAMDSGVQMPAGSAWEAQRNDIMENHLPSDYGAMSANQKLDALQNLDASQQAVMRPEIMRQEAQAQSEPQSGGLLSRFRGG